MNSDAPLEAYLTGYYATYKSLEKCSFKAIKYSIRALEAWHGRPVLVKDLSDSLLAGWIEYEERLEGTPRGQSTGN